MVGASGVLLYKTVETVMRKVKMSWRGSKNALLVSKISILLSLYLLISAVVVRGRSVPPPVVPTEELRAVYLPAAAFTERRIAAFLHYARQAGINAAVLHVKDPRGRLHWQTDHPLARAIGAVTAGGSVEDAVRRLKEAGVYTIAKVDIFADSLLAASRPALAVPDAATAKPWSGSNGLHWTAPCDREVWSYNIALCRELAGLGFDEIQFDYIRFPSDGDLSRIPYPALTGGRSKVQCISGFLAAARSVLSPLGVKLSADLFGLTAWKRQDFGVGQVLEAMAPHVDVLCPMLYPSHFPEGFLGWKNPGAYPEKIVRMSLLRMRERTRKPVRPWIQGFWYNASEISLQLDGVSGGGGGGWAVWNPSGTYSVTWLALSQRLNTAFSEPKLYPALDELRRLPPLVVAGLRQSAVNVTNYRRGYTILSLELPPDGRKGAYSTPIGVVATLDEGIMDRILAARTVPFGIHTAKGIKALRIAGLLSGDIGRSPRRIRPMPIYIDWRGPCRFTLAIPSPELSFYLLRARGEN